jgi:hypothetical protein
LLSILLAESRCDTAPDSCGKVKLLFGACTTTDAMTEPQQQHQRHHVYDILTKDARSASKQTHGSALDWYSDGALTMFGVEGPFQVERRERDATKCATARRR